MLKSVYEKQSKPTSAVGNKQLTRTPTPNFGIKIFQRFQLN